MRGKKIIMQVKNGEQVILSTQAKILLNAKEGGRFGHGQVGFL